MEREPTAKAQLKLRLPEPLRAALEEAAAARGVSLNAEAVARLQHTVSEDAAFGGPEMRRIAYLMATSFSTAGRRRGGGNPRWPDDPDAYRAALAATLDALLLGLPDADPSAMVLELEAVKGQVMGRLQERRSERPAQDRPAKRRPAA